MSSVVDIFCSFTYIVYIMSLEYEIINKNVTPPGGWVYTQPESGRTFRHYSFNAFMDAIREHRLGNGYPISADWQAEIINGICRDNLKMFPDYCQRSNQSSVVRRFSFGSSMSFLSMLWEWISAGRPFVEQEEAERRAEICSTCPFNQSLVYSCGSCFTAIINLISKIIGRRKTRNDSKLGSCGICSCSLQAAVHFPLEAQQKTLSEDIKNDFKSVISYCWKAQGLK